MLRADGWWGWGKRAHHWRSGRRVAHKMQITNLHTNFFTFLFHHFYSDCHECLYRHRWHSMLLQAQMKYTHIQIAANRRRSCTLHSHMVTAKPIYKQKWTRTWVQKRATKTGSRRKTKNRLCHRYYLHWNVAYSFGKTCAHSSTHTVKSQRQTINSIFKMHAHNLLIFVSNSVRFGLRAKQWQEKKSRIGQQHCSCASKIIRSL